MSDTPKFDETEELEAPKFEDTEPVSFDDTTAIEDAPAGIPQDGKAPSTNKVSQGESLLRGAAQGASFGLADEGTAHLGTIKDILLRDDLDLSQYPEVYKSWRDVIRKRDAQAEKDNKGTFVTGQIGGGVLSSVIPGVGALNAGKGAKLGEVMTKSALQGGLGGYGSSESDNIGDQLIDTAQGTAVGGIMGAAGRGVQKGVEWGAEKLAKGGAKILATTSDEIDRYVTNPSKYRGEVKTVESVAKDLKPDLAQFERIAADAAEQASKKKEVASRAAAAYTQGLRETRPSPAAEQALTDALSAQRGKASELAAAQRKIVAESPEQLSIAPLLKEIDARLKAREIEGVLPSVDPEVQDMVKMKQLLESVRDRKLKPDAEYAPPLLQQLQEEGSQVSPQSLVNLRQTIDKMIEPTWGGGAKHIPAGERAGRALRGQINESLDSANATLPGYQELRGELADATRLAEKSREALGDPDTNKVLRGMANPNNAPDFQTLKQLDHKTGKKVMPELAEYLAAKGKLRMPDRLEKNISAMPQTAAAEEAAKKAKLYEALNARLNGISSDNIDTKLREALFAKANNPKMQTMDGLKELARRTGKPIEDDIDIMQVQSAFGKQGAQGSRLVNWLSNFMGGGLAGGGLGTIGAGLDTKRGKVAQGVLDKYLDSKPAIEETADLARILARGGVAPAADAAASDKGEPSEFDALLRSLGIKP